jgi:hypothetical protein
MDFIKENYHTNYAPKLDIDKYCYYADETNHDIIIKLISDYRKDILGEGHISCKDEIARFMGRLEHGPICVYFESLRVAYDNLYEYRDTDDTYAARHDYKVIKLEHKNLMTIE